MPADAAARAAALDITQSFLVQAPAGSGKTELLSQRFLALLAVVDEPESIIAITFTRKAAGEMRTRICKALERAGGAKPESDHERSAWHLARAVLVRNGVRGWGLMDNPSRLRIMTIDSLSASLTAQMPWLSRMGGPPSLDDDSSELYREASLRTLALLETELPFRPALELLLLHLDNNHARATEMIATMLAKRDQWLRHLYPSLDRERLENALQEIARRALAAIAPLTPPNAFHLLQHALGRPASEGLAGWIELADLLLTNSGSVRKTVNKNQGFLPGDLRKQEMIDFLRALDPRFVERLAAIRSLPPGKYAPQQWKVIAALVEVLQLSVAQLRLVFQERGVADFTELTLRATEALGGDEVRTSLAYALDCKLQHILLDEFQDTSISKMALLERLISDWVPGDGRTIFAVGDPMQSIYSFQEAEVGLFGRCRANGIGQLPLRPLTLSANFRSSANMVAWFNATFPAVLSAEDDPDKGTVAYSPSVAERAEIEGDPVEVHHIAYDDKAAEAIAVADIVQASGEGTVAVLVRRRTDAEQIVRELHRRGIRYQAVEMDPLGTRSTVQDLQALVRAVVHTADRVAWLSVLRAPWCGLVLADLHTVAAVPGTIYETLQKGLTGLSADGQARLTRVFPVLEAAVEGRRRGNLRGLVEETWLALGGPASLQGEEELEDARSFFLHLDDLDNAADLRSVAALQEALLKLCAPPDPKADGRIQIMTMHKAKGLEFDTVILPALGARARGVDSPLLRWRESGGEILIGCIRETGAEHDQVHRYLGSLESNRLFHEAGRLLYVAATRARRKLHLLGALTANGEVESNSMLARLWPAIGQSFMARDARRSSQKEDTHRMAVPLYRLRSGWEEPARPAALDWTLDEMPVEEEAVAFDWSSQTVRLIGTAVHAILQQVAQDGLDAWPVSRLEALAPVLRARLATLGVARHELDSAVGRATTGLRETLTSGRGRWILGEHQESRTEWELSAPFEGAVYSYVLDRTFVDNQGTRWIIDYKTGEHLGGDGEAFLDIELNRYRQQLSRYAEVISRLDSRPIRLGLYFPLMGGWREWAWERDAASISVSPLGESKTGQSAD